MTEPTRISRIDEDHRLVVHATHAELIENDGTVLGRHQRNPLDDDKTWAIRAKHWARQMAEFISPAN